MPESPSNNFKSFPWHFSYKTSSTGSDGRPVDILHDFYIPALARSIRYDRVAGYFRSSSLAVASQGFSAFTQVGGGMRMVVGADMNPADVAAVLKGDSERLAAALNRELNQDSLWPKDVENGVALLAWMVAKGVLDIRIAFRVHKQTGKPLPFDAVEDGYVHEKWAVFTDAEDNRLYVSGSLNESRTALVHNAENIDVHADWWGDIERRRANEAQAAFETLWNNTNPHIRTLTLPEAVQEKLIDLGNTVARPMEIDGTSAVSPEIEPPSAMERLRFSLIKDGPCLPGGRFVGMATAAVAPWPHQEVVARRLIETWPYTYLLCDEVGLGKTIEAGLAIRSLVLSGLVRRVLITPPASLTRQWQREMASKFFMPFARALSGGTARHEVIFPRESTTDAASLFSPNLCIVSTGLVSRKERQPELKKSAAFDIVLVDEAHYARRRNPKNGLRSQPRFGNLYRTISEHIRSKTPCLWMATATPMQLDWIEVFDLLTLTRRVGAFQFDPSITWAYYQTLGRLVQGGNIDNDAWEMLRRVILSLKRQDPILWDYLGKTVIDGQMIMAVRLWLEHGIIPKGIDRRKVLRLIFLASPLSRVMLRHGRPLLDIYRENGQLGANLARREILAVPRIVLSGIEKSAYEDLEYYCEELTDQISAHNSSSTWRTSLGLYLSFLRLRLASSLFAIRETLKRRKEKVAATLSHLQDAPLCNEKSDDSELFADLEDEPDERVIDGLLKDRSIGDLSWEQQRLDRMIASLEDISAIPLKMWELLRVLNERKLPDHRIRQTVVFTRFFDTLKDLVHRLLEIDPKMLIGTYSGQGGQYVDPRGFHLRSTERDEIKHRFLRGEIDILLCTDAAAEGLNLQTADLLVNYDLPWNPMKVEQRIGRIDRIGQKYERISVLNLCYADSAEQIVYERLLQRLVQAGYVVGMQQVSMLPVTREEFNDLAARTLTPEELEVRAKERIQTQKEQTQCMEIPSKDLFEIYMRLKGLSDRKQEPITLDTIWQAIAESRYLKELGCVVSSDPAIRTITLCGSDNFLDGTVLTPDRDLFEKGLKDSEKSPFFSSYGDPVFEKILNVFTSFELPGCIQRLTEPVPGTQAQVVAYAVASVENTGITGIRLITSWADLNSLVLDETIDLEGADLTGVKIRLQEMVRKEFEPILAIPRLERQNQAVGHAHAVLNLMIADSLLPPIGTNEYDNFWTTIKDLDRVIENRDRLLIPKLNAVMLRRIKDDLLFDVPVPNVGDETSPSLPITLVTAALDAACRLADGLKGNRSDITIGMVKTRINREFKNHMTLYSNLS